MTHDRGSEMKASDKDGMSIEGERTPARIAPWRSRLATGLLTAMVVAAFGGPFNSFAQQVQPVAGLNVRVDQAGNGVPVVQIAAPNAAGVSHNQYSNYNVEAQGQILNNSQEMVKSQLGGYILGNTNLQPGQSARIIVNEVTSAHPSQLKGHIEVAGKSSEVVIANPNGITCAGCGFINTTRNTLTTGTPIFGGDGSLSAFQVTRGLITVDGNGLNSSDRVDLIARAVQLNAGLWAEDANVVTGANRVGYADLSAQAIAGEGAKPGYGLDVSAIGGMYAQKIRLAGTEAGVGVRSAGEFVATGGDFVLTSAGDVQLSGRTAASSRVQVDAAGTAALTGRNYAEGDLRVSGAHVTLGGDTWARNHLQANSRGAIDVYGKAQAANVQLDAAGNISLAGQVQSVEDMSLRAGASLTNSAQVVAGRDLQLSAADIVVAQNTQLAAQGRLDAQARNRIDNAGRVRASTKLNLHGGRIDNSGAVYAATGAEIAADSAINNTGTITSDGSLALRSQSLSNAKSGTISTADALNLQVQQAADNAGQWYAKRGLNLSVGSLDNRGTTYAQDASLSATGALRSSGSLIAGSGLTVQAGSLDNSGEIGSETGDIALHSSGDLSSTGKTIAPGRLTAKAGGALSVAGQAFGGKGIELESQAKLHSAGTIDSNGDIALRSGAGLDNAARIVARGAVELKAATALNNVADIQAARIKTEAQRIDHRGRLLANGDIQVHGAQSLTNSGTVAAGLKADGRIGADGAVALSSEGSLIQSSSVLAGRSIDLRAKTLMLNGGKINSGGDAKLSATGDIDNTGGTLTARNALSLQTQGAIRNVRGQLDAAKLRIGATALENSKGTIVQSGTDPYALKMVGALSNAGGRIAVNASTLSIAAANIDNTDGRIEHAGTGGATLEASGNIANANGLIVANGALGLQAGGALNNAHGKISGVGAGSVLAQSIDNSAGTIASDGSLRMTAQQAIANQGGGIVQRGAGSLELRAAQLDNRSGGLVGAAGNGSIAIAGELDNRGGKLFAQSGLSLSADGALRNNDGGAIQSGAALTISTAGALDNTRGKIDASGVTQIRAASLNNAAGRLVSDSADTLDVAVSGDIDNRGGTLGNSRGDTTLRSAGLDNGQSGRLIAGRDLSLTSARFGNASGLAYAERDLFYRNAGTTVDNAGGEIGAGRAVAIEAATLGNNKGRIVAAQVELTLSRLENEAGDVSGSQRLNAVLGALAGNNGRLFGHERATIRLFGDYTHNGSQRFESNGVLALNVDGTLTNQGTLQSAGELQVNAAAVVNTVTGKFNSSRADDSGMTRINAGRIDNAGRIEGDGVSLTAADLINTGTVIGSRVRVEADRLTNGRDLGDAIPAAPYNEGFIGATERTELRVAEGLDNLDAEIYSVGDVVIAGRASGARAGSVRNRSARISAERDVDVAADRIENDRRLIELRERVLSADEQAASRRESKRDVVAAIDDATRATLSARYNNIARTVFGHRSGAFTRNPSARLWSVEQLQTKTELIRASAESQILSSRDIRLVASERVLNRASRIAGGHDVLIDGRAAGDAGANVNNIAIAGTGKGERVRHAQIAIGDQVDASPYAQYRRRGGGTRSDRPEFQAEIGRQTYTVAAGTLLSSTITAGRAVQIDAHNVSNGAVGTIAGSNAVKPGQWNGGAPNAPGLGHRNEVGGISGGTGTDGVGGLLSTNTDVIPGNGGNTTPPQVIGTPEQPLPNIVPPLGRLFTSNPGSRFLVESDPRFASQSGFLGSDYLLGKLGYSPGGLLKRLGDDFYEQRLVMEQITGLTGRKYLGASTGLDQYRDLMDAGASTASRFHLTVGIALTTQQIAALEQDIVWMVEQEVKGQKVLVPVVYLSKASAQKYRLDGASIAAQDVSIHATGTVHNAGTIRTGSNLDLSARNLLNSGALKAGGVVYLAAINDVVNRNGKISGGQVVITAGRDIVSETRIQGMTGPMAGIESAGGVSLDAGRDLALTGSKLKAGGNAALSAGRDLALSKGEGVLGEREGARGAIDVGGNLALSAGRDLSIRSSTATAGGNAVATAGRDLSIVSTAGPLRSTTVDANNTARHSDGGTTQGLDVAGLKAGQNVVLQAGQDINLTAAQLDASKAIGVNAGRDVVSTTVTTRDTTMKLDQGKRKTESVFTADETLHGTQFKAKGDIALKSGRDIDLTAAAATTDQGAIGLAAGRDVNLRAGQETHAWEQDVSKKKSGTLSTTKTTTHDASQDQKAIGTLLSGDAIAIAAGRDITTQAAQVAATNDVILAAGRDLTVGTADSTHSEQHEKTKKKTGIYSSGGFNITAGQTKVDQSYSLKQTTPESSLIGSTQGKATLTAGDSVRITGSDVLSKTGTAIVGKNVTTEAAVGTTESKQTYKQQSAGIHLGLTGGAVYAAEAAYGAVKRGDEVRDDRLKALYVAKAAYAINDGMGSARALAEGQNPTDAGIRLRVGIGASSASSQTATRDEIAHGSRVRSNGNVAIAATAGDLNVTDTQIEGKNVALAATHDINLLSQAEQHRSDSKNKNGSAEVGVSLGSEQTGMYVTAQAGRGNSKGNGTNHAETTIKAGDTLSLVSGGNTTIKGAQATADKVLANIGGNLRIESEQDTDDYASKRQQAGGTYVYGSGSNANFGQQKADGSYRSVNEQSGIAAGQGGFDITVDGNTHLKGGVIASTADPSKNRLSTGSLTAENIRNKAEYKASSVGVSAGDAGGDGFGVSPGLPQKQSDSSSSTTRSGISAGSVDIRDGDADAVLQLDRSVNDLSGGNGLKPIFDQRKIDETFELGQLPGEIGFRAAGTFADNMGWKEGGKERTALHGLVGAAMAALGGGDALQGMTGAAANQWLTVKMQKYLADHQIDPNSAQGKTLMRLGALAVGKAVGGNAGASAALAGEDFNRQLHPDEKTLIRGTLSDQYAKAHGLTKEQAIKVLAAQLLRMVDTKTAATEPGAWDPQAAGFLKSYAAGQGNRIIGTDQWGNAVPLFGTSAGYQRQDGTIFSSRPQTSEPPKIGTFSEYFQGALSGPSNFLLGVGNKVVHPINTATGIWNGIVGLVSDPVGSGQAIQEGMRPIANAGEQGNFVPAGAWMGEQLSGTGITLGTGLAGQWIAGKWVASAGKTFDDVAAGAPATATEKGFVSAGKNCEFGICMRGRTPEELDMIEKVRAGQDRSGDLTEKLLESMAKRQGYEVLPGGKYGSNNGFDVVLKKPDGSVTLVVDGKPMPDGTFKLAKAAGDHVQLTDDWINTVLSRLPDDSPAKLAIREAQRSNKLATAVGGVNRVTGDVVVTPVKVPTPKGQPAAPSPPPAPVR